MIIITCIIGCLIALAEVLSRYPRKSIKDLFCLSFFIFILFNVILSLTTYYFLPNIFPELKNNYEFERSIIAGLGYAVILKSKVITLKFDQKDISLGPAFLYESFTNYILLKIKQNINSREVKMASEIAAQYPIMETYIRSINTLWFVNQKNVISDEDKKELEQLKNLRNQLVDFEKQSRKNDSYNDWIINASFLMLKHFGNKVYVTDLLKKFQYSPKD